MSPQHGDELPAPSSIRPSAIASVFRGLTGSKSTKSPPPVSSSAAALPRTDFITAIPISSRSLSTAHADAFELLKNGSLSERIAAAGSLKVAITEYPLNPVLDIWYAGKDLIEPAKASAARAAGWDLLRECVKHASSTDLERKEYFQTVAAPAHPDDFHLQLAALVDLTHSGRVLTGFDYELLPLLTRWLQEAYAAARSARRLHLARGPRSSFKGKVAVSADPISAEDKNFGELFSFILDVIKFSFNNANEAAVDVMIDGLLSICLSTAVEDDIRSCIAVVDAIVTFGSIPSGKLEACVLVLSSVFSLVPALNKESWHTLSNLCKSHNGQAIVRILLDVIRNRPADCSHDKEAIREIRGALAALQTLLSKTSEEGYPTVPFALLVDGLSNVAKLVTAYKVQVAVLDLILSLFHNGNEQTLFQDGKGHIHRLILEEDWSGILEVAAECFRRLPGEPNILVLIDRLDVIIKQRSGDFVPRQSVIKLFTDAHTILPDSVACTVLDYFQEFRCCSPSDLQWEENLTIVLDGFFSDRKRSSDTRLRALYAIMDAYEIVDLVGDGGEQNFIPRLARSILQDVGEETDIPVLEAVMTLMISVVTSCDMELFEYIIDTLGGIVVNDGTKSPPASYTLATGSVVGTDGCESPETQSLSNVVTKGHVKMLLRLMNFDARKSVRLFQSLVNIAKLPHCEIDARLTAMKVLFRLRADWAHRVFITTNVEAASLATALCRTDVSLAKKQAEEAANMLRHSRGDHGGLRASRSVPLGQDRLYDRGPPVRAASVAMGPKTAATRYQQIWKYPDPEALADEVPSMISPILVSHVAGPKEGKQAVYNAQVEEGKVLEVLDEGAECRPTGLDMSTWLEAVLSILRGGSDWEVYSFVLVHLPSQLSNHAIFRDAIPQIQELRRVICEQIRMNGFQEPPNACGLRRADVAICLYQSLTMILSYHEHFQKSDEDEIVKTFVHGISTWERCAKCCIHALSICCHELPLSTSRSLIQMLNQMAAIITQPFVSVHILEFLACLSRLHNVYVNFREDEYRIVFAICFRYLEYARERERSDRSSHVVGEAANGAFSSGASIGASSGAMAHPNAAELLATTSSASSDDLPQYVHALAYHVILFWFLALRLPDRANHVGWIVKKLFADADGLGQGADEQAITSIDFMQRVTYADADESAEDASFTSDRFGDIVVKRWLIGNSIVTIKQATSSGWAQIIKRQPSGTSAYTIRELYVPPPPHQIKNHGDISSHGLASSNAILPSHLLVQLLSPIPQSVDSARPIALPEDDAIERSIRVFDRYSSLDGHKVGVIYIGEGQTEENEILANVSGSSDYTEFLNHLGTLTKLKGATFNTQGLDREHDVDGQYTFCWRDRVTEIVFHVTTQMPTNLERDAQCILKKRHIGNDFVNIIFNDSGLPFRFDTFPSQFNFVNIVITPASPASFLAIREAQSEAGHKQTFYTVRVMSKPGFPEVSPAADAKMVSLKALPGFIRLLALNASVFSMVWWNREGGEHISSWSGRLREIKRLRERYGPRHASDALFPCHANLWQGQQHQQQQQQQQQQQLQQPQQQQQQAHLQPQQQQAQTHQDASRPGSSVRDSFNSLRRTSVATFFTSMSEQASHRSSVVSTVAGNNDTEMSPPNGLDLLVDSVDFSKWA